MMKLSKKIILTLLATVIGLNSSALGKEELTEQAKRILEQLEKYEERELKEAEEEVLKIKKDVLKSLERSEKRIDSEGMLKLYAKQIETLKREIAASESMINGEELNDIVIFGVVYRYDHPMELFSKQIGEMIFYGNKKVKMVHKDSDGKTSFDNELNWEIEDGKIVINGPVLGEILITNQGPKRQRLNMEWTRLKKTVTAKGK